MPLVHRVVAPVHCSNGKLELRGKYECEFVAVNNVSLVNVLKQLAGLVGHASDIFSETALLTEAVGRRIRKVKLKLEELEAKTELFDPKLVPVPEGSLDDVSTSEKYCTGANSATKLFSCPSRPRFMGVLFDKAGSHAPNFPPRSPITTLERVKLNNSADSGNKRPASFAALRDWKLDDYLDEKIASLTLEGKGARKALHHALATPFPSQVVPVDVTGQGFDRMRKSRRSLVIHTKRIRRSRRRNTICGTMPNKECGIQTSFSSVNAASAEGEESKMKKYGIDSGHWSSCTTSSAQTGGVAGGGARSTVSWGGDHASISTSSDFLYDDEDRCLTPQLEHFTDGLVSDSDSVDTDGYFTSFRSDCGFPKSKKQSPGEEEGQPESSLGGGGGDSGEHNQQPPPPGGESDYDLFGQGSTASTTASSCGTVVLRRKPPPSPPTRRMTTKTVTPPQSGEEEERDRVARKSLIEPVPSLVVVTPSPNPQSPPPLKDPTEEEEEEEDSDSGRITPRVGDDLDTPTGTISSDTDSEMRAELGVLEARPGSSSGDSEVSTMTLTEGEEAAAAAALPRPDVIPSIVIRTRGGGPKLVVGQEYCSLDTVQGMKNGGFEGGEALSPGDRGESRSSSKIRGARVVLDGNGEIIFASETLRRKRRHKVSFDPGSAVKTLDYDDFDAPTYGRLLRESVYDRILKKGEEGTSEKLYETIEEIRKQNLRPIHSYSHLTEEKSGDEGGRGANQSYEVRCSSSSSNTSESSSRLGCRPPISLPTEQERILLETDLDSGISDLLLLPPKMSDLKNLPKIKDRLKRNESYRMANTDEERNAGVGVPNGSLRRSPTHSNPPIHPRPTLLSLLSPQLRMNSAKTNRRMSFSSSGTGLVSNSNGSHCNGNLHLNKKRDILEEDPVFIAQILNATQANSQPVSWNGRKSPGACNSGGGGSVGYSNSNFGHPDQIQTLSKLALSPEDRPTFLRRGDDHGATSERLPPPPTMDEISKEIYRYRKKFNLAPTGYVLPQLLPQVKPGSPSVNHVAGTRLSHGWGQDGDGNELQRPRSSSTIPAGFPKLLLPQPPPITYSSLTPPTGVRSNGGRSDDHTHFLRGRRTRDEMKGVSSPAWGGSPEMGGGTMKDRNPRSYLSWSEPSSGGGATKLSVTPGGRTSLQDFKKLLLTVKRKKSPVCAMDALKPKGTVGGISP